MYVYMGRDKKENEEGGGEVSVKVTLEKKKGGGTFKGLLRVNNSKGKGIICMYIYINIQRGDRKSKKGLMIVR